MSSEWPLVRLGDLVTLKGGFAYKGEHLGSGEVKLLGMGVVSHSERFLKNGMRSYGGEFSESFRANSGDIVIATRQQSDNLPILGCPALVPSDLTDTDIVVGTNLYKVTNQSDVDNKFLYWLLRGNEYRNRILECSKGTTVRMITKDAVENFTFPCPPLPVRREISHFLDALDDRITLLRETNATLEAIAQALFKSWFVDFDPVRAKMEGRTPEGMDEATAALFPDGFEASELGEVPRGWRAETLGSVCSYLNRGLSPKYLEAGGVLVLNQKCIRDFSVDFSKGRRHDPLQRKIDGREVAVGDVLVNSTGVGTLGRVAQVLQLPEPVIVDSHVTVVRAGPELGWPYLGQFMARKQPEIEAMGEGSTGQTELGRAKLASLPIVVPSTDVLTGFGELVRPLKQRVAVNERNAQTLSTLRDTLLPRLISGQLRLPEAQAALGNAWRA